MKDRIYQNFEIVDLNIFKTKMLNWLNPFSISCLLDSHAYHDKNSQVDCIIGVANQTNNSFNLDQENCFQQIKILHDQCPDWYLGHFNFEANHQDFRSQLIPFPVAHFFRPDILLILKNHELTIGSITEEPTVIFEKILNSPQTPLQNTPIENASIFCIDTEDQFIQKIKDIQQHIQLGNCYEMNYCTAFYAEQIHLHPLAFYQQLSENNPSPFAAYYRYFDKYLISASPERFLQKKANLLRSQPIKGTIKRGADIESDLQQKKLLLQSSKDQAENVMIVDLVRNDLSMVCKPGTVKVEELMQLYTFPFVHQLISTVVGELKKEEDWATALKVCYPMGSMTGAPKKKVIELTQQFEQYPRGIFSGSIGYIQPNADFDFNVVIRSVLYDENNHKVCFPAGAGITIYSNAKEEWEECKLKIANIKKMLAPEGTSIH